MKNSLLVFLILTCRENDEEVGMEDVEEKVKDVVPKVPEKPGEVDKVYDFFLKLAGEDQEVDWKELKEILDYSMRDTLELPVNQTNVSEIEATPGSGQQSGGENSVLMQILGLICGTICKDTALAEFIPPPTDAPQTMNPYDELRKQGFSKDVCRSMVAMLDEDRSGKLGFKEFKDLYNAVKNWKTVFKMYDKDNSGALSGFELRQALNSAGFHLNNHILNILMHRFGNKKNEIEFDDFVMCAVKLKTMIDLFKERDLNQKNEAKFTLEEWVETTLYS